MTDGRMVAPERKLTLDEAMRRGGFHSDAAFARALGMTNAPVGYWRTKQHLPRQSTYQRILDVLQLRPEELDLEPARGQGRPKGLRHTDEARERIRVARRAFWAERRQRELAMT